MKLNKNSFALTILIVVLGHFCVDMMIGVFAVFKTLAELDLAIAGLISAVSALIGEGMQLLFGHLSDRGHQKKLLIGGLCAASGCAFLAYVDHYWAYFALFLLTCMGSGAFHPTAASLVHNLQSHRKGLLMGLFAAGGTLGMAFSQILYTNIYRGFGGHTALLTLPLLFILPLIFLSQLPTPSHTPEHCLKATWDLLRQHHLRLLYFSQVCCQSVIWAFLFFLPEILLEREYDSWIALGGGHMVAVLGGTCMLVPAGYLADRYSCRRVLLIAMILSLFALYSLLYFPFLSNLYLFGFLFFLGATLNVTNAISVAFGNQINPGNPGKVGALLMGMVWCISEGIGQGGGGLLTKLFSEDASARALSILGSLLIVAIGLTWRLPNLLPAPATLEVVHD